MDALPGRKIRSTLCNSRFGGRKMKLGSPLSGGLVKDFHRKKCALLPKIVAFRPRT